MYMQTLNSRIRVFSRLVQFYPLCHFINFFYQISITTSQTNICTKGVQMESETSMYE